MPSFMTTAALAAITILPSVSAHGYIGWVKAGEKTYPGGDPGWTYQSTKPDSVGWYAENQDNGYVDSSSYSTPDIICHKGATPGNKYVEVAAGDSIDLIWNTWPESHKGPVYNYLARCNGDCTKIGDAKKDKLDFFVIEQSGLKDGSASPGTWATDDLIAHNNTQTLTIPSNLKGNFVLRHEIVALHSAGTAGQAQHYPQCINLKVTGSGKARPCDSGADCAVGEKLYKADDFVFNIYQTIAKYSIPGLKKWGQLKKRYAQVFKA